MPSRRSPVSKEIISDSEDECDTAPCRLHNHVIGTNVLGPTRHSIAPLVDLLVRKSSAKDASKGATRSSAAPQLARACLGAARAPGRRAAVQGRARSRTDREPQRARRSGHGERPAGHRRLRRLRGPQLARHPDLILPGEAHRHRRDPRLPGKPLVLPRGGPSSPLLGGPRTPR